MSGRRPALTALGGSLIAVLGAIGVLAAEGTRLGAGELDPWVVVYALGLAILLGALPFGLRARLARRTTDLDKRWELALVAWGGIALAGALGFAVFGLVAGFDPAAGPGALAVVGLAECGLVAAALLLAGLTGG